MKSYLHSFLIRRVKSDEILSILNCLEKQIKDNKNGSHDELINEICSTIKIILTGKTIVEKK